MASIWIDTMIWQILGWSFVGSIVSLVGGIFLAARKKKMSHAGSLLLVSFAAGVLLATAFFDLLPEAFELSGNGMMWEWVVGGIVFLFLLEKSLIWYHHHHDEEHNERKAIPELLTIGDSIHNFIDGVVMGGTFLVSPTAGVVTALAIAAHEIPHEMADFGVLLAHGWSAKKTIFVNLISAAFALLGSIVVYLFKDMVGPWLPYLLAFAGGGFIYLSCSDLIPELHHEHRMKVQNSVLQFLIFGLGIVLVWWLIRVLEG